MKDLYPNIINVSAIWGLLLKRSKCYNKRLTAVCAFTIEVNKNEPISSDNNYAIITTHHKTLT